MNTVIHQHQNFVCIVVSFVSVTGQILLHTIEAKLKISLRSICVAKVVKLLFAPIMGILLKFATLVFYGVISQDADTYYQ